jgi:hypothetical protein
MKGGNNCRMRANERKKLLQKEQQGELGEMGRLERAVCLGIMAW